MKEFKLDLAENNLWDLSFFREGLKYLPVNLQSLELYLSDNNLEENSESIKYLAQSIK